MFKKITQKDVSQNHIILIILSLFQTLTLLIGVGTIPIARNVRTLFPSMVESSPDRVMFLETRFWLVSLIIGGVTLLVALVVLHWDGFITGIN